MRRTPSTAPSEIPAACLDPRLPEGKAACQKILRQFGHKALKIESIEQPDRSAAVPTGRVYALTQPVYVGPNNWRRQARTVIFCFDVDGVTTTEVEGWVV